MGGLNQTMQETTPPPIKTVMYNVAVNGQATGPFDMTTLNKMAVTGELSKDSLVWTQGMSDWVKACDVEGIKDFFTDMPPIPKS